MGDKITTGILGGAGCLIIMIHLAWSGFVVWAIYKAIMWLCTK